MPSLSPPRRVSRPQGLLLAAALAAVVAVPGAAAHGQSAPSVLRIGSSGSLTTAPGTNEKAALETLKDFIKEQTGLDDEIVRQKDWRELADKMSKGRLHLGDFQGYEFAWAQEKYPGLRPLAVAVNVYTYPTVYVVTRRDNPPTNFAGLQGQSVVLPAGGADHVSLFIDRQCEAQGKTAKTFFSRVTTTDNVEDAVDDVVDGKVQAVAADRAALEAYKQRKPGRFGQLKAVATSAPFPPAAIVADYEGVLDQGTRQRVRDGLLRAHRSDRGQTLLTMFKLTRFDAPPPDLDRVLAETRKAYPPPGDDAK
jgi:ABC-type phosphate/phosphonate transport system substrate-binding protein